MKVLLDECVDWRLSRAITGHEVKSGRQMGWTTIKNGALLALAAHFNQRGTHDLDGNAFVTVDRNLAFQ